MNAGLPPLPSEFEDGTDWLARLADHGWHMVADWGLAGWSLLEWPHAAVGHYDGDGLYGMAIYEEGDITVKSFASRDQRDAATDRIAAWYWRRNRRGPEDLPEDDDAELAPHQRGPFSMDRVEREGRL